MFDKNGWWAAAVANVATTICWALLAVYFDRWWIALFAWGTWTNVKFEKEQKREEDDVR